MASQRLKDRRVLVYVGGSIAAFKAATLVTDLVKEGAQVRVAMTPSSLRFITPLTLEALSGNPVTTDLWEAESVPFDSAMGHLNLSAWGEVQVAVAASANLIARLALGLADDAVTATALASTVPMVIAPAMESAMWGHPATQAHVKTLAGRGATFAGPTAGRLASGREGEGRMVEPSEILLAVVAVLGGT